MGNNDLIVWFFSSALIGLLVYFVVALVYDLWKAGIFKRNRKL